MFFGYLVSFLSLLIAGAVILGTVDLILWRDRCSRHKPIDTKPSAPVGVDHGNRKD